MAGPYFANFSTRGFELRAYRELAPEAKASVSPVVTLTRARNAESFLPTMLAVMDASEGREVIVDFDPMPKKVRSEAESEEIRRQKSLRDQKPHRTRTDKERARSAEVSRRTEAFNREVAGFVAPAPAGPTGWIAFVANHPHAVPIVQLKGREAVVEQVRLADELGVRVAFRPAAGDASQLAQVAAGLGELADPAGATLLVEAAHVRGEAEATVRRLDAALKGLKDSAGAAFDAARKAVVVGSFPGGSLRDQPRTLRIEETRIHASVAERWAVSYGDHCSLPPKAGQSGGNGFFPHVDLVVPGEWLIELDESKKSDAAGYTRAAVALTNTVDWDGRAECWGTRMIAEAAAGRRILDDITLTVPGPWIAIRMNQHMTRRSRA